MGTVVVVAGQPVIKVFLQVGECRIDSPAKSNTVKFIQSLPGEAVHETVRLQTAPVGATILSVIQLQIKRIRMSIGNAKFMLILGRNGRHRNLLASIKRWNIIVQHRYSRLRLFRDMQETKSITGKCVHNGMHIDLATPLR